MGTPNGGWASKDTIPYYLMGTHGELLWGVSPESATNFSIDWLIASASVHPYPALSAFSQINLMAAIMSGLSNNPYTTNFNSAITMSHPSVAGLALAGMNLGSRLELSANSTLEGVLEATIGTTGAWPGRFDDNVPSNLESAILSFRGLSTLITGSPGTLIRLSQFAAAAAGYDGTYLKQAYSAVDSAVLAITNRLSAAPLAVWSANRAAIKTYADADVGPSSLSSYVQSFLAAQEAVTYPAFQRRVARYSYLMGDQGAINSSAYALGLASLEDAYSKETADVRGKLVLDAYNACINYLHNAIQQVTEIERGYLSTQTSVAQVSQGMAQVRIQGATSYLEQASKTDAEALAASSKLAEMEASRSNHKVDWILEAAMMETRKFATLLQSRGASSQGWSDLEKTWISAVSTYEIQKAQATERRWSFAVDQFMHGATFLGALQGAPIISHPPTMLQQMLGTIGTIGGLAATTMAATAGFGKW